MMRYITGLVSFLKLEPHSLSDFIVLKIYLMCSYDIHKTALLDLTITLLFSLVVLTRFMLWNIIAKNVLCIFKMHKTGPLNKRRFRFSHQLYKVNYRNVNLRVCCLNMELYFYKIVGMKKYNFEIQYFHCTQTVLSVEEQMV